MTKAKANEENVAEASDTRTVATVTLDEPIQRKNKTIETVVLTRPKGGALRGISLSKLMNEAETDEFMKVIPRISEPQILQADWDNGDLAPSDLMQMVGEISLFFVPKAKRQEIDANA